MLGVHVVVKNLKLEISACRFADYVKNATVPNYVAHVQQDYFFLIQPISSLLPGVFFFFAVAVVLV